MTREDYCRNCPTPCEDFLASQQPALVEPPDDFEDDFEDADPEPREDGFRDDVEADADTLKSAGWGTDEDYGYDMYDAVE